MEGLRAGDSNKQISDKMKLWGRCDEDAQGVQDCHTAIQSMEFIVIPRCVRSTSEVRACWTKLVDEPHQLCGTTRRVDRQEEPLGGQQASQIWTSTA